MVKFWGVTPAPRCSTEAHAPAPRALRPCASPSHPAATTAAPAGPQPSAAAASASSLRRPPAHHRALTPALPRFARASFDLALARADRARRRCARRPHRVRSPPPPRSTPLPWSGSLLGVHRVARAFPRSCPRPGAVLACRHDCGPPPPLLAAGHLRTAAVGPPPTPRRRPVVASPRDPGRDQCLLGHGRHTRAPLAHAHYGHAPMTGGPRLQNVSKKRNLK